MPPYHLAALRTAPVSLHPPCSHCPVFCSRVSGLSKMRNNICPNELKGCDRGSF